MSFIRKIRVRGRVYLAEVENVRVDGKVVQRHIRYVGRAADGSKKLTTTLSHVSVDQVRAFGPLLVLDRLARNIGLHDELGPFAAEILSLVYAHCMDYKSVNKMEQWFGRTDLNMMLGLEGLTESRLLDAMDSIQKLDLDVVQRRIFEKTRTRYKLGNRGVIYDVTNTYFHGRRCPLGKFGKDKDGVKGRPIMQIGLGVTRNDGVPVFHQVHDGNVSDSRMFQDAITTFRRYGIVNVLVVFDRGISSKKNQLDLKSMHWSVLCGLPLNEELKRLIRDEIKKEDITQYKNRVPLNDSVFYVRVVPYAINGVKGRLAFCVNDRRRFEAKENRYREIAEAQELIGKRKSSEAKDSAKRLLGRDGRLLGHKLADAEEFDGVSCIFTTTRMTKEEMVAKYFDKDLVEKAFAKFKGILNVRPIRHWLENRVKAKVFICYLAYLLLAILNIHMKKIGISSVEALDELETMYKVFLRDRNKGFRETRIVTLTKKQEKIIRAIDRKLLQVCY